MFDYLRLFAIAHRHAMSFYARRLEAAGIAGAHFQYLLVIRDHPGLTQDQLAEKTMADKSTIAKAVRLLMEEGIVRRRVNADDRRAYNLYVTEKAKSLYQRISQVIEECNLNLTRDLTEVERLLLKMLLEKLNFARD